MKQLLSILTLIFTVTLTAQAQHEPYISYSTTDLQADYHVNVGNTWDIGSDVVDLNTFVGLTNDYVIFGSGVDVVSGYLLGMDLFLGADIQYAVANRHSVGILTPKAGFTFPVAGSRVNLYTSVNQYGVDHTRWIPLSISLSF